jgi:hypothetical protein
MALELMQPLTEKVACIFLLRKARQARKVDNLTAIC